MSVDLLPTPILAEQSAALTSFPLPSVPVTVIDHERCLKVVARVYQMRREDLIKTARGKRNEARGMAMMICRKKSGMKLEEIARIFGVQKYSAVSSAIRRMTKEIDAGGEAMTRYEQIKKLLI